MISKKVTKWIYNGDGSITTFQYVNKIFADGDLVVVLKNTATLAETPQTLNTDYSVTGVGNETGGNVVFTTAPATGYEVIIYISLDLLQGTDYVANDPFPSSSHEDALDRLTLIAQQLQEQLDRALLRSVSQTSSLALPDLSAGYLYNDGAALSWTIPTSTDYNGSFTRGLDASKPASPGTGDLYFATDTGKWYGCKVSGSWAQLNALELSDLSDGNTVVLLTGDQTIAGVKTFSDTPKTDAIAEKTADTGVTVDGCLIKDGEAEKAFGVTGVDNSTIEISSETLQVKDAGIPQAKLKTSYGEISVSTAIENAITLPGGEYGFYPQFKGYCDDATGLQLSLGGGSSHDWGSTFVTGIAMRSKSGTITFRQRYITASGKDHWILLKVAKQDFDEVSISEGVEKVTHRKKGEILSGYQAPDHPCYGNGDDPEEVSQPFGKIGDNEEVVVIDNSILPELVLKVTSKRSLLTIINEDYKIDMESNPLYQPREHLFIDEFGDKGGEVVKKIKTPQWAKIKIGKDEVEFKKKVISNLPSEIKFKKLVSKGVK